MKKQHFCHCVIRRFFNNFLTPLFVGFYCSSYSISILLVKTKDDFSLKCVLAQHKLIINKISSNIWNISWIVACFFNSAVLHFDHLVSPKFCEWVKYSCYCESVHLTDHTWSWWNKPVTVQRDSATLNIIIKVSIFILTDENQNRSTESFTCQAVNTWT